MAGALGGFTTTIITNPLDIIRARLQVSVQNHQRLHIGDYLRVKLLRFFFGPNIFEMCLLCYQNTTSSGFFTLIIVDGYGWVDIILSAPTKYFLKSFFIIFGSFNQFRRIKRGAMLLAAAAVEKIVGDWLSKIDIFLGNILQNVLRLESNPRLIQLL